MEVLNRGRWSWRLTATEQIKPVQQQISAGICKVSRHIVLQKEKEIAEE